MSEVEVRHVVKSVPREGLEFNGVWVSMENVRHLLGGGTTFSKHVAEKLIEMGLIRKRPTRRYWAKYVATDRLRNWFVVDDLDGPFTELDAWWVDKQGTVTIPEE